MKNNIIPVTYLIVLALSSNGFAKKASDETIDILSSEAAQTDMSEAKSTIPEEVEPAVTSSQDSNTDELSASIAKQLSSILGSDTDTDQQDAKKIEEKLEEMVSSALLDGVDMGALSSAVSEAMEHISATQEAGGSKKIKQASQSLNTLIGEQEPSNKVLQAEVEALGIAEANETNETSERTVTVLKGESLYKLALRVYGRGNDYLRLYNANKDVISDPNIIRTGQVLRVPW